MNLPERAWYKWQLAGCPAEGIERFQEEAEADWIATQDKLTQAVYWLSKKSQYKFEGDNSKVSPKYDWGCFISVPSDPKLDDIIPRKYRYSWRWVGPKDEPVTSTGAFSEWGSLVAKFICNEFLAKLDAEKFTIEEVNEYLPWLREDISDMLFLRHKGVLSAKQVKEVFEYCWSGVSVLDALIYYDILAEASEDVLAQAIEKAFAESPKALEDYKKGKKQALNSLIGPVLRILENKVDVKEVKAKLESMANDK